MVQQTFHTPLSKSELRRISRRPVKSLTHVFARAENRFICGAATPIREGHLPAVWVRCGAGKRFTTGRMSPGPESSPFDAGKRHGFGPLLGQEQVSARWDVLVASIFARPYSEGPACQLRVWRDVPVTSACQGWMIDCLCAGTTSVPLRRILGGTCLSRPLVNIG